MIGSELVSRHIQAANHQDRKGDAGIDILLLHYTGMDSAEAACDWLCREESGVSCHYLIDEQGVITQMVGEDRRAWHAGVSFWQGETDINSRSIGIEIHNRGHEKGNPPFPDQQMDAVIALGRDICERNGIRPERVLAHSDVAPGRKVDPGELFDWKRLHEAGVGHWIEPAPIKRRGACMQVGDEGLAVETLEIMLAKYGYKIPVAGVYDEAVKAVVEAFQRHFRPALVDGIADHSTLTTLNRLLYSVPGLLDAKPA